MLFKIPMVDDRSLLESVVSSLCLYVECFLLQWVFKLLREYRVECVLNVCEAGR
ncbi:unnamed protein product [Schistosoma mattheei]|uniref:Uncharacterized protein n=1 Tax=Schistosoma mattheei TaxID=31246 RepID=A0A3P8FNJ6_9TREM|nr:unnamed protein product [Schistosoma mattheei]